MALSGCSSSWMTKVDGTGRRRRLHATTLSNLAVASRLQAVAHARELNLVQSTSALLEMLLQRDRCASDNDASSYRNLHRQPTWASHRLSLAHQECCRHVNRLDGTKIPAECSR